MLYQIIALLFWSSAFIAAKAAYTFLDPILVIQVRLIIAAMIVLPLALKYLKKIPKVQWKALLYLSFVNYILVLVLQFTGLKYTSAASAVTILGLEPLMTIFIGHCFFGDHARPYHWICGFLAFIGVLIMILGGENSGDVSVLGCTLIFLGGVAFVIVLRPTQRLIRDIGAEAYTAVSIVLAMLMCLPFSFGMVESYAVHWNWTGALSVLYLGVCCSWLAYLLWNKGMNSVPANLSGLLIPLEPLFGVLFAVFLLGEQVSLLSAVGIAVVIATTLIAAAIPTLRKIHYLKRMQD